MLPQAVPLQPEPATPLCSDQVTEVLLPPALCAENWSWLGDSPEGARNAYGGKIVTESAPGSPGFWI